LEDIDREKIFLRPFEFGGTLYFRTPAFHTPFLGKNSVKIGPNRLKTLLIVFPIHENHIPIEKNKIWKNPVFTPFWPPFFSKNPEFHPKKNFFGPRNRCQSIRR